MPFAKVESDFPWTQELLAYDSACASLDWFFYMTDDERVYERGLERYTKFRSESNNSSQHTTIWTWHFSQYENKVSELAKKTNPPQ